VTREDAVSHDTTLSMRYRASKTLAEQAAWEFAESHPEMDLTTRAFSIFIIVAPSLSLFVKFCPLLSTVLLRPSR
jgi:hypothetical protein